MSSKRLLGAHPVLFPFGTYTPRDDGLRPGRRAPVVMTHQKIRTVVGSLYAIAIVAASFFANGKVVAVVAVIGAIALGMVYRLTAPAGTSGDRDARRAARRVARRDR